MNENGLSSIKDGKGFNNVICTLTDFRRAKDFYELSLRDNETRKSAYLRANLYSFDQLRELKNKTVLISGLHEAGLKGVIPEKIKVKVIELKSEEDEDILNNFPHLEDNRISEIVSLIKKYVSYVGKEVPGYRHLLELYFSDEMIKKMKTMPATHIRQGSPLGGMLHATLVVTELAYTSAMHYLQCANGIYSFADKKSINWDLLLTGALMHLAGNFFYYSEEIPHQKTDLGVEQGFSNCRQQFILRLAIYNHINLSDEEMGALLGVMARLNEQKEGIQKCRHEAFFLEAAYNLFLQMDSYDSEIYSFLKFKKENTDSSEEFAEIMKHHVFLEHKNIYVSSDEIRRKASLLGFVDEENKNEEGSKVPC